MTTPQFPTPPRLEVNGREVTPEMLNLVFAGPALYSALRMIVESHDATCPGESCGIMGIDLARAALERARGEVQP
jgi:hypothetical protein